MNCLVISKSRLNTLTVGLTSPKPTSPPKFSVLSVPLNYSQSVSYRITLLLVRVISSTLKMEATCSSESSVHNKLTRCHVPEACIQYKPQRGPSGHRCKNSINGAISLPYTQNIFPDDTSSRLWIGVSVCGRDCVCVCVCVCVWGGGARAGSDVSNSYLR
jgi:hypothetical protein